ncbi:hypothetical protein [Microbispora triticiradicis]|uniref:hypothetical protein n=1 Tax=Microbispora TaxID=2005 RepID=UPI00142EAB1C|nr:MULTISPECIES: hypothetical protein [Microbispora]
MTAVPELTEAEAISRLLAYLPHAGVGGLLELGRTCPADDTREAALEDLRERLVDVVGRAHAEAVAAEQWVASLEDSAGGETSTETAA